MKCASCGRVLVSGEAKCECGQFQYRRTTKLDTGAIFTRCPKCNTKIVEGTLCPCLGESPDTKLTTAGELPKRKLQKISPPFPVKDTLTNGNYVEHPPQPPQKLEKGKAFTIGRHKTNDLVISSNDASRHHATIAWQDDGFVIKDLDSRNGIAVNEQKTKEHKLQDGDIILIGTNVIYYFHSDENGAPKRPTHFPDAEETQNITDLDTNAFNQGTLSGEIEHLGLANVLQVLGTQSLTGCLKINKGEYQGSIYLREGTLVHSELTIKSTDALFELMKFTQGNFKFERDDKSEKETMSEKVEYMLLEMARRIDEEEKNR